MSKRKMNGDPQRYEGGDVFDPSDEKRDVVFDHNNNEVKQDRALDERLALGIAASGLIAQDRRVSHRGDPDLPVIGSKEPVTYDEYYKRKVDDGLIT